MANKNIIKKGKPNQTEIKKLIDASNKRKWTYLVPDNERIEFIAPVGDFTCRFIENDKPFGLNVDADGRVNANGQMGVVKYFYLGKLENKRLTNLFDEFLIPDQIRIFLVWGYLNMVFAACKAPHENNFHREQKKREKELQNTMELLESFAKDENLLRGFTFEYLENKGVHPNGKIIWGGKKFSKFSGYIAAQFLEKVLKKYKEIENFDVYKSMVDDRQNSSPIDLNMGYKNSEKHSQSYYCSTIYDIIANAVIYPAFEFYGDRIKFQEALKKVKATYSRRKLYLFIGKLMTLSKLLVISEDTDDEDLIELIEKKMKAKLDAQKSRNAEIDRVNRTSNGKNLQAKNIADLL